MFTESYKNKQIDTFIYQPPPKQFEWKNKPKEKVKRSMLPSANFRSRLVHPLTNLHKKPAVMLSESRATSLNSLLSDSLESLAYQDKLIEETNEKELLGEMYEDKQYLQFLLGYEGMCNFVYNKTSKSDHLNITPTLL